MNNSKKLLNESYVNLIPTAQGGSHLNGFKSGLLDAIKEFVNLKSFAKGIKLTSTIRLIMPHLLFHRNLKIHNLPVKPRKD